MVFPDAGHALVGTRLGSGNNTWFRPGLAPDEHSPPPALARSARSGTPPLSRGQLPSTGSRYEDVQTGRSYESVSRPVVTEEGDAGASGCAAPAQRPTRSLRGPRGRELDVRVCALCMWNDDLRTAPAASILVEPRTRTTRLPVLDLVVDGAQRSLPNPAPAAAIKKYSHPHTT